MTLPDISRSYYSTQIQSFHPPTTIRSSQRGCIVQVDCPEFKDEELSFHLHENGLQLIGTPISRTQDLSRPVSFNHRIPLEFNTSAAKVKSVYVDGIFSIFIHV